TLCTIDRIVERLVDKLRALAADGRPVAERLRDMLLTRVLFRFDSIRDYSHGLDELFASLLPAYLARRQQYFDAEAAVFAEVIAADGNPFEPAAPGAATETPLRAPTHYSRTH